MEEVDDEVFYSSRSLVFPEAENRKWTIMVRDLLKHIIWCIIFFFTYNLQLFSVSGSDGFSSDWPLSTDPQAQILTSGLNVDFYLCVMMDVNSTTIYNTITKLEGLPKCLCLRCVIHSIDHEVYSVNVIACVTEKKRITEPFFNSLTVSNTINLSWPITFLAVPARCLHSRWNSQHILTFFEEMHIICCA